MRGRRSWAFLLTLLALGLGCFAAILSALPSTSAGTSSVAASLSTGGAAVTSTTPSHPAPLLPPDGPRNSPPAAHSEPRLRPLFNVNVSATPSSVDVRPVQHVPGDYNTTLRAFTQVGYQAVGWSWSGLPAGCLAGDLSYVVCSPTRTGNFTISVEVEDSEGQVSTAPNFVLTVNRDPVASIAATPAAGPLPFYPLVAAEVGGGQGPFTYTWSWDDQTNTSTADPAHHLYLVVGTYQVQLQVVDADGGVALTTRDLSAVNPLQAVLRVLPDNDTYADRNLDFNVSVIAGTGLYPYVYAWSGLPVGCQAGNVPAFSCLPNSTGKFNVEVSVSDAAGETTVENLTLIVHPLPRTTSPPASPNEYFEAVLAGMIIIGAILVLHFVNLGHHPKEDGAEASASPVSLPPAAAAPAAALPTPAAEAGPPPDAPAETPPVPESPAEATPDVSASADPWAALGADPVGRPAPPADEVPPSPAGGSDGSDVPPDPAPSTGGNDGPRPGPPG